MRSAKVRTSKSSAYRDSDAALGKEFIKTLNMTCPKCPFEILEDEGAQLYAVNSIPHTMLIDI